MTRETEIARLNQDIYELNNIIKSYQDDRNKKLERIKELQGDIKINSIAN